jgi:molecular chaperone DnaK
MLHSTDKSLRDGAEKLGPTDKTTIENAMANLREAVKGDNLEAIKAKTQALAQASLKIGEAVYGGGAGGPGGAAGDEAAGGSAGGKSKDNVVDADFEEVKDDKKKSA